MRLIRSCKRAYGVLHYLAVLLVLRDLRPYGQNVINTVGAKLHRSVRNDGVTGRWGLEVHCWSFFIYWSPRTSLVPRLGQLN